MTDRLHRSFPALLFVLLAGCAAPSGSRPAGAAAVATPAMPREDAGQAAADAAATQPVLQARAGRGPDAEQLARQQALFADPAFRARLLESYVAETDTEPKLSPQEREVMAQVMDLIGAGDLQQAAALLEEHATPGASAAFDFTLGNVHFQLEQLEAAVAAYEVAVQKHPKFRRAWGNLGVIHYKTGSADGAVRALSRVIELGGGDATIYGMLGIVLGRRSEHVAAESAFRMACMLDPDKVDWKLGLADTFFKQRRFADAASLFDGLLRAYPDRADLWRLQGESFAMLEMPTKAIENFEMVDRLGGSTFQSLYNLADLYANQEMFDPAVDAYLRALDAKPDADLKRAVRATRFLYAKGALPAAATLVDGIERRRGDTVPADLRRDLLNVRLMIAAASGDDAVEAGALQQLVELDPLDGDALIELGKFHERHDRIDEAVLQFERAARIDGCEGRAKQAHGQLLVRRGDYADALPLLRRALEVDPRPGLEEYVAQVERAAKSR